VAIFVINEWLWEDVSGSNGLNGQREAFKVINKLASSEHQIVVIEGSAFDRKAWRLCKNDIPMIVQRIAGLYVERVRWATERCMVLNPADVLDLPPELAAAVKGDDHYLVQALRSVPGAILVTTDGPLREAVTAAGLLCLSREAFLVTYL
jgi:hypothetical protein